MPKKSPVQFNVYLAAIERDLLQQDETALAMTFYSKLTAELKRQFKKSDIAIPETRAKCVAVAQRIWEGLYKTDDKRTTKDSTTRLSYVYSSGSKHNRHDSSRDRKDSYHREHHREHRSRDDQNKDKSRHEPRRDQPTCYSCNKPGHYATDYPDRKGGNDKAKAKIQSAQQDCSSPRASTIASSRASTEAPWNRSEEHTSELQSPY